MLLACSKGSLDNTLAIEDGLFTKGGLSLDTASIVVGVGLNDTYWINRGITPEYLSTLSGGEEMTEVCQIPDKVLIKIPTAELVDICLSYPLGFDFLLSNDESYAIDFMINNFNGLTELANRTAGPDELINAYASINKTSILCQFIEAYAENLLSSSIFLSNLSSDAILLLKNVINKKNCIQKR